MFDLLQMILRDFKDFVISLLVLVGALILCAGVTFASYLKVKSAPHNKETQQ